LSKHTKSARIVSSLLFARKSLLKSARGESTQLSKHTRVHKQPTLLGAQEMSSHKSNKIVGSLLFAKEVSTQGSIE
jgi:hypothetical protein